MNWKQKYSKGLTTATILNPGTQFQNPIEKKIYKKITYKGHQVEVSPYAEPNNFLHGYKIIK